VTIKVNIDQEGQATTNGLPALADFIAPSDSPVVRNLRRACAIIVGRTNTPEVSMRLNTVNPLHTRTFTPCIRAGRQAGLV
jgi:amidase